MNGATSRAERLNVPPEAPAPRPAQTLAETALPRVLHLADIVGKTPFYIACGAGAPALLQPLIDRGVAGFEVAPLAAGAGLLLAEADVCAGLPAQRRFDILILAPGAPAGDLANLIAHGAARPACVYVADAAALPDHPQLLATLRVENYITLAQFAGAEIYLDGACVAASPQRPALNSFDVFDTLIARRCGDPHLIFDMVEAAGKVIGFARQRRAAEARLAGRDYTLDDIYDELGRSAAIVPAELAALKALELAFELEAVVPIAENLRLVADGDLLISDMYLSEAQIRALLEKAGLKKHVGLFVSSRGKHAGTAWRQVASAFDVKLHVGDNRHADIEMAKRFNIPARLTQASDFNIVEGTLGKVGLRHLARLCRAARLMSWHDEPRIRAAQCLQTSVNFPLLLLASVALARKAAALKSETLLFCSRDCNLWLPLFDAVQKKLGSTFKTKYFLTSRLARKKGSEPYLRYARDNIGTDSLIIDLCGTGWSTAILAERLGLSGCNIFLLHRLAPFAIYERWKPTPASCVVHSLFETRPNVQEARVLELANMADHGMLTDMRAVGAATLPVLAPRELTDLQAHFLRAQRAAFDMAVGQLDAACIQEIADLDAASIQAVCASLLEFLSQQAPCFEIFWTDFVDEDKRIMRELMA